MQISLHDDLALELTEYQIILMFRPRLYLFEALKRIKGLMVGFTI